MLPTGNKAIEMDCSHPEKCVPKLLFLNRKEEVGCVLRAQTGKLQWTESEYSRSLSKTGCQRGQIEWLQVGSASYCQVCIHILPQTHFVIYCKRKNVTFNTSTARSLKTLCDWKSSLCLWQPSGSFTNESFWWYDFAVSPADDRIKFIHWAFHFSPSFCNMPSRKVPWRLRVISSGRKSILRIHTATDSHSSTEPLLPFLMKS